MKLRNQAQEVVQMADLFECSIDYLLGRSAA